MILVTGGTGLVGSHLLLELTGKYNRVRAIHRPRSNYQHVHKIFSLYLENPDERYNRIEWVPGDITNIASLYEVLNDVDHVYHAAAEVSFNPGERLRLLDNNVGGTANVVNACLEKKINKLCFVSSTAALGNSPRGEIITEDLLWTSSRHRSFYSISKFKSEMEVWRGIAEGLNAVIINPSIIIGPGDWQRSSSYLFTAVWKGMKFYTKGITGYVDIMDVVRAMRLLMEGDFQGERYIVSSENLSYQDVLSRIAASLGKKPPGFYAAPLLTSLSWRIDWLLNKIIGKKRILTRETALSSNRKVLFSNQKIREAAGIKFTPVQKSIEKTAGFFIDMYSA